VPPTATSGDLEGAEPAPHPPPLGDGLTPSLAVVLANALECTKFVSAGASPRTPLGCLQRSPRSSIADLRGPTSKGEEEEREIKGRGRGREGPLPLSQIPGYAPWTPYCAMTALHVRAPSGLFGRRSWNSSPARLRDLTPEF